jgi:polar amino acid transport system substrate-binding protein
MKKVLLVILVLTLALALVACGNDAAVNITAPADLTTPGVRIGVQLGTTGHIHADDNLPDAVVITYDTNSDAVLALLAGDVDALIMDSEPARSFVARNANNIKQLDELLTQEAYGIALPLGSPYTAMFDEAINTLRDNGTLYALIDYWVNEDPNASRYESPPGTQHPNGTLLMGTNADFPPFEFIEYGEIVGLDPDIARAIGDLLGYEIEIMDMDFAGIILAVQTGTVDFGMAGMTITEERRQHVDFTQGYFLSGQSVIVPIG